LAAKAREALMMIRVLFVLTGLINSDSEAQELLSIWLHYYWSLIDAAVLDDNLVEGSRQTG
jgi:hypothetical protein